jgi:hypothetical protein
MTYSRLISQGQNKIGDTKIADPTLGGAIMMKLIAATFALLILGESIALAACPPGTR